MTPIKDEPNYSRNVTINFMGQLDWPQGVQIKPSQVCLGGCLGMRLHLSTWQTAQAGGQPPISQEPE